MIEGRFTTDGFTVHRNGSGSTMLHHQALHTPVLSEPHPSPPQNNSARTPYRIEYFRQPLDHFNLLTSNQTFQQRYLREDSNFSAGGPIFAFTGGEGGDVPRYYNSYAAPIRLARRLGGMIIFMEMRFFGASNITDGSAEGDELCPTADRLGLLSVEQVLADYTRLLSDVLQRCGDDCTHSAVITFGGSLAGTLAALMRLRASWLVDFAWASSSPLFGFDGMPRIDQYSWRRQVTDNWRELAGHQGEACVRAVRQGFAALARSASNASRIAQAFNVCQGTYKKDVAARIASIAWGILEGDGTHSYPPALSHIPGRCRAMLNALEGAPSLNGDDHLSIFQALLAWSPAPAPAPPGPARCLNLTNGGRASRNAIAWDYLACTEGTSLEVAWPRSQGAATCLLTRAHAHPQSLETIPLDATTSCVSPFSPRAHPPAVIHPIGSNNVSDFFPPVQWKLTMLDQQCRAQFANSLKPRPHWLPTEFGFYDSSRFKRSASHILFTYGTRDPWATLGVGFGHDLSPSLPVIAIPDGSHCADMADDESTDTAEMRGARKKAFAVLTKWIHSR